MCFNGGRRPCYGDIIWFRVGVLGIHVDILFLFKGAISLSISFWFSASILVRSDMIFFLRDVFISVRLSGSILGTLLELATRFSDGEFSVTEVSKSPETNSATACLFWLLVVILLLKKRVFGKR